MATASVAHVRIRLRRRRRRSYAQEQAFVEKIAHISEEVAALRYRLCNGQYADSKESDRLMRQFERALRQRSKLLLDVR